MATFNELTKWDYIKAEQEYLKGKELEPNNLKINNQYREFLVKMNRLEEYDSAKFYLQSAMKYEDPQMLVSRFQACLALMYQKSNNHQPAQNIINQLIDRSKETTAGSPGYFIGWYYSGIGEADSAFIWLEKAYQNRSMEIPWLKADPVFKNLKNDDRYWDLYERAGHKAYDEYMASKKK